MIGLKVGIINSYHVGKHFKVDITNNSFSYERNAESIEPEAAFDCLYVIRTSVIEEILSADETVKAYDNLTHVE